MNFFGSEASSASTPASKGSESKGLSSELGCSAGIPVSSPKSKSPDGDDGFAATWAAASG